MIVKQVENELTTNTIRHLARLSDCIFAFAMALTVVGFDLPENIQSMTNTDINQFLMTQLKPLGTYVITFILVAVYWIAHSQQLAYYKRTDEVHLWIGVIYLMCLFLVPLANDFLMTFPENVMVKTWFSLNISAIGFCSFVNWVYATSNHRLVDANLDKQIINATKIKALIEPVFALLSIGVAFWNQELWDYSWLAIPVVYILVERFFKRPVKVAEAVRD